MQTFKEISYQNYIELRFNPRNLQQAEQQEALIKYKRNAQLLAEIFSFEDKPRNEYRADSTITPQHLKEMEREVEVQKVQGQKRCQQIKEKAQNYARLLKKIKQIKNEEQRNQIIKQLQELGLYDEQHPYFAKGSPFLMNSTEEEVLEVQGNWEIPDESTLSLTEMK